MGYTINDSQREILRREMTDEEIEPYVKNIWDSSESAATGSGDAAVEAKIEIIKNTMSSLPYDEIRRREYPSIGDQLDALYHSGVFPTDMAARLKAVKDANPKK